MLAGGAVTLEFVDLQSFDWNLGKKATSKFQVVIIGEMDFALYLLGMALALAAAATAKVVYVLWWWPMEIRHVLERQRIRGMPYRPLVGNTGHVLELYRRAALILRMPPQSPHDTSAKVVPHFHDFRHRLGEPCYYWFGLRPRLVVGQPRVIRHVFFGEWPRLSKIPLGPSGRGLVGPGGLSTVDGPRWARQRRALRSGVQRDALAAVLVSAARASAACMMATWREGVGGTLRPEIEVLEEFRRLTADVIAAVSFGSSYEQGKRVFDLQGEQATMAAQAARATYRLPGSRFIPTKDNIRARRIEKEIRCALRKMIQKRMEDLKDNESQQRGKYLLDIMVLDKEGCFSMDDIIDNCKTFYFAGHEATSVLLTWCVVLLAMYPEWQQKTRQEVVAHCGSHQTLRAQDLSHLKTMTMVVNETLRLYPPVPVNGRRICRDFEIEGLTIPEGVDVLVPTLLVHHDEQIWGSDAKEFNPQRFADGVANALLDPSMALGAYLPFGLGPRICVGMNFALIETKVVLAMILQRFEFRLSPSYVHCPHGLITIRPQHGAQVIFNDLS